MKSGKKRKSLESESVISHCDINSPDFIPSYAKKRKTDHNKESRHSSRGIEEKGNSRGTSSVILMMIFSTCDSLPSEDEIIQICNNFAVLNKMETKILYDTNTVQIVHKCGSETLDVLEN